MKIFDCFMYWDEDLLLDLRINVLNKFVDYFVIVEGNKTWQNNPKKFNFQISKFKKFEKKIIYIRVTDLPDGKNPWKRENFQRNCILRGLQEASNDDLIMISDLDEIPNPKSINLFKKNMRYAVFEQNLYRYKFNLQSQTEPLWLGTRVCLKRFLKSPQWLRELKFKKRPFWRIDKLRLNNIIKEGGWHFCDLKTPKKLLYKFQNVCETDDQFVFKNKISKKYLDESKIKKNIRNRTSVIGKDEKFKIKKIDKTFPAYIIKNQKNYRKWIL